jgi:hypothetical protein
MGAEHYANIRRTVVLHRMAAATCLDDRLFWGIILWSWCGPERSEGMVLKDARGFIRRDNQERPIPAKLKDLRELLGLAPNMKGNVSRAIQRLVEQNSIHFDGGILYPDQEPTVPEHPPLVVSTDNFCIGTRRISTDNLPTDPVARARASEWLQSTSTAWNSDLKTLRTRYNQLLEQAARELGIIIVLKKKNRRVDDERNNIFTAPSLSVLTEKITASSSVNGKDDDDQLSAEPNPRKPATRPEPNGSPHMSTRLDPELAKDVIAAFVMGGKPSPTPQQILALQQAIPDEPAARIEFVPYLREKMPRIKHPGSLPKVAEEFTTAWPALVAREQTIRDSARRSAPKILTAKTLRVYLEGNAAVVPYPEIADALRRLAADVEKHLKDPDFFLERQLTTLEEQMTALAHDGLTPEQMAEVRQITDGQIKEYRGKMSSAQLSGLEKQYRERNVLEKAQLPRLSLYYMP